MRLYPRVVGDMPLVVQGYVKVNTDHYPLAADIQSRLIDFMLLPLFRAPASAFCLRRLIS